MLRPSSFFSLLTLGLGLLLVLPSLARTEGLGLAQRTHRRVLKNGVTLLVVEDHKAPVVDLRAFIRNTGGLHEGRWLGCGISHNVEHLVSGGSTPRRSEAEAEKIVQSIGGISNAYTSKDYTAYFITTSTRYFDPALDVLSDWIQNCRFAPEEVTRERQVITQEIKKALDEPSRMHYQLAMGTMYLDHPVRIPTLGYLEQFLTLTRDDLMAFHRQRYIPQNLVFVVAGDLDPAEAFAKMEKAFGGWNRGRVFTDSIPLERPQTKLRRADLPWKGLRTCTVRMDFRSVDLAHPDMYPLDLLSYCFSRGRSSPIYQALVASTPPMAREATSYSYTPSFRAGRFGIYLQGVSPKDVEKAVETALSELDKFLTTEVSPEALRKAMVQKRSDYVMYLQKVDDLAETVGGNQISLGDPAYSETYLRLLDKVTPGQILSAARRYIHRSQLTITVLRPAGSKTEALKGESPDAGKPTMVKTTFQNGLRLLLKPTPGSGIISIQAWCRAGLMAETVKNNGINRLMARLLLRGTRNRKAIDIDGALDAMGAEIKSSGGNHTFGVEMKLLAGQLTEGMKIFADVMCNPAFAPVEVANEKRRMAMELDGQRNRWGTDAYYELRRRFFHRHPYRLNQLGTRESLARITPADVTAFHGRFFVPDNMVVAVFGDIDVEEAQKLVNSHFGNLPRSKSLPELVAPTEEGLEEAKTVHVERDFQNVVVMVAWPAPTIDDSDRYAMSVIDVVTSGGNLPSGWLHEHLRGRRKGLVYYVHATNWAGMGAGAFYVTALTTPDNRDAVVGTIMAQMQRLLDEDVSEEEVRIAKQVIITEQSVNTQSVEAQASQAALMELYGLGYDFAKKFARHIDAVTVKDIRRVAKKYFKNPLLLTLGQKPAPKKPEAPPEKPEKPEKPKDPKKPDKEKAGEKKKPDKEDEKKGK